MLTQVERTVDGYLDFKIDISKEGRGARERLYQKNFIWNFERIESSK